MSSHHLHLFCIASLALVTTLPPGAHAQGNRNESVSASSVSARPDALLQIDLNRPSVVDKIVESWKAEIPAAQIASFRSTLSALRSDQLLAASATGSFDAVLEIVQSNSASISPAGATAAVATPALGSAQSFYATQSDLKNSAIPAAQNSAFLNQTSQNLTADSTKALGDANADLVYTPLVPCRLFDTRAGLSSALGTVGGTFSNQQTKTISPAGACGIPTSGVASLFLSFHAYNNNPSTLGVIGFMKPAAPFSALAATWTGANWATGTFITQTNPNGSFDAFVGNAQSMTADMIVDVMGYFRAPQGSIAAGSGDITDVLTAAASGLTGGVTSGAANLSIASTYKLPQACANGQVAKYNTATLVWECANDLQGTGAGGAGTVTNIATGAGLSGGPITSTGTINLASTQLLPITACADSQTLIWNATSSRWICAAWNNIGFGATLFGTNTVAGFRVVNSGAGAGTGILGDTVSSTFQGAGVKGTNQAETGFGVGVFGEATVSPTGTGVNGFGSITGGYFEAKGAPSAGYTPTGLYGVAAANGIGVKAIGGTALEIDGAIKVSGPTPAAFRLVRTVGLQTSGTIPMDNILTNFKSNAIILVTPIDGFRVATYLSYIDGIWNVGCYPENTTQTFFCPTEYNILVVNK
jgi:hypothetical protein